MTPSNAYMVDVLNTLNIFAFAAVLIMPVMCGFLIAAMFDYYTRDTTKVVLKKVIALCVIIFILSLATVILVPSRETLILIYGGK